MSDLCIEFTIGTLNSGVPDDSCPITGKIGAGI